jgi:hypothetical protein
VARDSTQQAEVAQAAAKLFYEITSYNLMKNKIGALELFLSVNRNPSSSWSPVIWP